MTCAQALDAMLECDPADLRATSDHPIAAHVRECARCSAVAATLTRGTSLLASPLAGRQMATRRRRSIRAATAVGLSMAAGLGLMMIERGRPVESVPSQVDVPPPPAAPAIVVAAPVTPVRAVPTRAAVRAAAPAPGPAPVVPSEDSSATIVTAAERPSLAPTDSTVPPSVRVEPMNGQRVAILKTSDPKITVVWIY